MNYSQSLSQISTNRRDLTFASASGGDPGAPLASRYECPQGGRSGAGVLPVKRVTAWRRWSADTWTGIHQGQPPLQL